MTQSLFTYYSTAYVHKNDQLSAHLMHFNNDGILRHITIKENPINLSTMTKDIIRLYNSNLNIPNFVMLVSFMQNFDCKIIIWTIINVYDHMSRWFDHSM